MTQPSPKLTIISHGLRDNADGWAKDMAQLLDSDALAIEWKKHAEDPFTCSVNARRIGNALGEKIAQMKHVKHLHLIAHSCGSFVSYGLCESIKKQQPHITIHSTYLDPVSVYGGFFWHFGVERFGDCADYAEAYIDTADTVPGSNVPLKNTHTYDVSALRLKDYPKTNPHIWPRIYYHKKMEQAPIPAMQQLQKLFPVGKTTLIFTDD